MPSEPVTVEEYFRGNRIRSFTFETLDEANDFVSRQGDDAGIEWVFLSKEA